ncbi:hypothetical protein [Jannaschia seosinensis]|uniref:hypothetical protein n=1 Tax=Jannaschia seosinensis TaxID=313367 RepID=UPI0006E32173|nr:hypothetical protein [Jannaschia seosinensis]
MAANGTPTPRHIPSITAPFAESFVKTREDVLQRPERWSIASAVTPEGADFLPALSLASAYLASSLPEAPGRALVRGRANARKA